jgi:DNA-binding HxlR family transcriptional regulator
MALPKDYVSLGCSLSRSLEVIGERWTLLIVRDAFYGVRRFSDFVEHLGIPRAVLSERLALLVDHGVLVKAPAASGGYAEYELTAKGLELWPIVYGLISWGDEHYAQFGTPRIFEHAADGGRIAPDMSCSACGERIDAADVEVVPGPGLATTARTDSVSNALTTPHRLLEPLGRNG